MNYKKLILAFLMIVAVSGTIIGINLYFKEESSFIGMLVVVGAGLLGATAFIGGINDSYDLVSKLIRDKPQLDLKLSVFDQQAHDNSRKILFRKLKHLECLENCPFALVGSTYLDIILSPIDTESLDRNEWSNIDPVKFDLGGSSFWVGRYLYEIYGHKSHLFSVQGGNEDPLTLLFNDLLANEKWLINDFVKGSVSSRTAITVHLVQRGDKFTTMFTHRGVLINFDWTYIEKPLSRILEGGGMLYLSGFLKTNLCNNFIQSLRSLPNNVLVAIEHGRLLRGHDNPQALLSLKEAFEAKLIDIYICTFTELWNFCHLDNHELTVPTKIRNLTEELVRLTCKNKLPFVTVVRGEEMPSDTKVFLILGHKVYEISGEAGRNLITSSVGPKNAFNASFLYNLVQYSEIHDIEEKVIRSAEKALYDWHNQRI